MSFCDQICMTELLWFYRGKIVEMVTFFDRAALSISVRLSLSKPKEQEVDLPVTYPFGCTVNWVATYKGLSVVHQRDPQVGSIGNS